LAPIVVDDYTTNHYKSLEIIKAAGRITSFPPSAIGRLPPSRPPI